MLVNGIDKMSQGLKREFQRLDLLSHNLSNTHTPGFRSFMYGHRQGEIQRWTSRTAAPVEVTNRDLDLRPGEESYFQVRQGDQVAYTRRGDLKVSSIGLLVLGSGEPVLSAAGQTIKVDQTKPITVNGQGEIVQAGKTVDQLGLYTLQRPPETAGSTLFTLPPNSDVRASDETVQTGMLDASDVSEERETVSLTEALGRARLFEAFARVQDQTVDQALQDLGRSQ